MKVVSCKSTYTYFYYIFGIIFTGDLLLLQTFCGSSNDWVLKVPDLGSFEMCGIKENKYPRHMALYKMQAENSS